MNLTELDPSWLMIIDENHYQRLAESAMPENCDGIIFLCPKCFRKNQGSRGTHSVICWQPHVPQTTNPIPGRWAFLGNSFETLTLVAGSSSISLTGDGCKAHFFIQEGKIIGSGNEGI